jgi:hypothetical protein
MRRVPEDLKLRTKRSEDIKTETQGEQSELDHNCEKKQRTQ